MNITPPLPRSVQEIADVIGRDAALLLVESLPRAYSGMHRRSGLVILYVPKTIKPDHQLVGILGWETAAKLVHAFGGEMLQPATCFGLRIGERNAAIHARRASGVSVQSIAREFHISDRQVRNVLREMLQVEANDNPLNTAAA